MTATLNDGETSIVHYDRAGKKRIVTATLEGGTGAHGRPEGQIDGYHQDPGSPEECAALARIRNPNKKPADITPATKAPPVREGTVVDSRDIKKSGGTKMTSFAKILDQIRPALAACDRASAAAKSTP